VITEILTNHRETFFARILHPLGVLQPHARFQCTRRIR